MSEAAAAPIAAADLVKTVDAAMKAAAAAEADRACDSLKLMAKQRVTAAVLLSTGAGKKIKKLAKSEDSAIAAAATEVVEAWKASVKQEQTGNGAAPDSLRRNSSGGEGMRAAANGAVPSTASQEQLSQPSAGVSRSGAPVGVPAGSPRAFTPRRNSSGHWDAAAAAEAAAAPERDAEVDAHNKAAAKAALKKTGVVARDKMRELLAESLSLAMPDVPDGRPAEVAAEVESALLKWGDGVTAKYKAKFRTLSFNLKDLNNPDLRRRVLSREILPQELLELSAEDLASDARKADNQKIREHALWDAERGASKQATTDQFQCGKCRQRKCTYYQMQTRSADEPMTTFVSCLNCNNRWKFC